MPRQPLPAMTPAERTVWLSVCRSVGLATLIYLGTLAWIMAGEFRDAPWTPARGPFMTSLIIMSGLTAGILTEGRAAPHRLKRLHGLIPLAAALLWLLLCLHLRLRTGTGQ